jgi:hypothetical protein
LASGLILTSWGELLRPDVDYMRLRSVKAALAVRPTACVEASIAFTEKETAILAELNNPAAARVYAQLDAALGKHHGEPRTAVVTLATLIRAHYGDEYLMQAKNEGEFAMRSYADNIHSIAAWLKFVETASSQKDGK